MTLVVNLVWTDPSSMFIGCCWRNPRCDCHITHTPKCNESAKIRENYCGLTTLIVSQFPLWCLRIATRVANLAFSNPDFEILTFVTPLAFVGNKKARYYLADIIWLFLSFFSAVKAWLWQNIVWAAYSLQISSDENLQPCRVLRILQRFYRCPKSNRCY